MGISLFIARLGSRAEAAAIAADVLAHNALKVVLLGERSREDADSLNAIGVQLRKMHHDLIIANLVAQGVPLKTASIQVIDRTSDAWSRGDLLTTDVTIVLWHDRLWVEVTNLAPPGGNGYPHGGADTTAFFERRRAAGDTTTVWLGTRGKPAGFMDDAKVIMHGVSLSDLALCVRLPAVCAPFDADAFPIAKDHRSALLTMETAAWPFSTLPDFSSTRVGGMRTGACAACGSRDKLSVCSGCGVAQYCGVACQKKNWKVHKAVCEPVI